MNRVIRELSDMRMDEPGIFNDGSYFYCGFIEEITKDHLEIINKDYSLVETRLDRWLNSHSLLDRN